MRSCSRIELRVGIDPGRNAGNPFPGPLVAYNHWLPCCPLWDYQGAEWKLQLPGYGLNNVTPQEARAMFQEALDILTAGLSNREVSYEGKYFAFRPVRLHIEPF
jgi:hypothetical protein